MGTTETEERKKVHTSKILLQILYEEETNQVTGLNLTGEEKGEEFCREFAENWRSMGSSVSFGDKEIILSTRGFDNIKFFLHTEEARSLQQIFKRPVNTKKLIGLEGVYGLQIKRQS